MKNFKQIAFGLLVGAMAIGFSAFTTAKSAKFAGAYYYNQAAQQPWGVTVADQTSSHYTMISGQTYSCEQSSNICSYDLVGGKFVQNSKGDNSLVP
ncbi:hypothetical protein ABIB62_004557 [Mucilaginibacter sp. UYP25]|uniref:hypothetical protein n=1 Tax=unclassified Mucilaginibacter TaxID=2617802 RepID=UPI0032654516